jgi:tetratricopeptide (TPR) repeat protein
MAYYVGNKLMTVEDYIQKLQAIPQEFETPPERYDLIEEAIRAHPRSATLWCLRGAFIQLGPDDGRYVLEDALESYRKAIEVEPECAEGWEELGHYYDVHLDDGTEARRLWDIAEGLRNKAEQ